MLEHEQFFPLKFGEGYGVALGIEKLDFENSRREDLNDGSDLTRYEVFERLVVKQGNNIK